MDEVENLLSLYIGYDRFFLAHQLGKSLGHLDRMYNALYAAQARRDARDIPDQARMQIQTLRTGNSVVIDMIEGVSTIVQSGAPVVTIPVAFGVTALMGRVLISAAKGFVELRKTWHEGSEAKFEARVMKRRGESAGLEPRTAERARVEPPPTAAIQVASEAAVQFVTLLEYSPNITLVKVNNITIVNKQADCADSQ